MTKLRYADMGCAAGSQVCGSAGSPYAGDPAYAWIVNFNNGNSNNDHRDNDGAFVRAVRGPAARPGECQRASTVSLRDLYSAWRAARRHKKPSRNQLAFDARWLEHLLALQDRLNAGTWTPAPSTCFIAQRPKAREIHAPDFTDRVVHHWLVPQLEALYEPTFIHDSCANRRGKGTHAALDRLRGFVRQVHSGQGGGWYLQLDVANFFNSVHRPTLWAMLKPRLQRAGAPWIVQRTTHELLRRSPLAAGVVHCSSAAERAKVPPHKRLDAAPPGCGLPIGNLSSQFFANVYLDVLDQFVKHELKAARYVRYVDDLVLVHRDPGQLQAWHGRIRLFLADRLRLELKADAKLRPLTAGIDFLGYIVYPHHTRIRPRVLHHAHETLLAWQRAHVRAGVVVATPAELRQGRSSWASYGGHFRHANSFRARRRLIERFPWIRLLDMRRRFDTALEGVNLTFPIMGEECLQ
jgi:RNA-directed DNA polymerase